MYFDSTIRFYTSSGTLECVQLATVNYAVGQLIDLWRASPELGRVCRRLAAGVCRGNCGS